MSSISSSRKHQPVCRPQSSATVATDYRRRRPLSSRDVRALAFIGHGVEVTQYQLHEAIFPARTANVVSRFVRRGAQRGLLIAERLHGIGMNRLRLTPSGLAYAVRAGGARADDLFAPRRSVALKDLAHTIWINDIRVALLRSARPPDVISPAWLLQRRLVPPPSAIPDLLAIWKPREGFEGFLIACEVDRGGESVRGIFAPKLAKLWDEVDSWAESSRAAVLVLTSSARRADLVERLLPCFANEEHVGLVRILPNASGFTAIRMLQELIPEPW